LYRTPGPVRYHPKARIEADAIRRNALESLKGNGYAVVIAAI
jgi:hypothetical protein